MKKIKEMREKQGLLQKDLADFLEMSEANYSKKEKGLVKFSVNEIQKLAKFFGVSIEFILENENRSA